MPSKVRSALAAIAITGTMIVGVAGAATPAAAATVGPGYSYRGDSHSHLGGFLNPDGTIGYCIDAGKSSPVGGATADLGVVDHIDGLGDAEMLQLAYVLGRYGNTSDDDIAAAVALAVWGIADPADHAARGGDGFVITRAPAARRATILALAAAYRAEAAAFQPPAPPSGSLSLTAAGAESGGVLSVRLTPADVAGTVTIVNGVFADTGSATREGVRDGEVLEITATPPAGTREYRIAVTGAFASPGHPDGSVHLYTTPGAQSIAASGRLVIDAFEGEAHLDVRPPVTLPRVAG